MSDLADHLRYTLTDTIERALDGRFYEGVKARPDQLEILMSPYLHGVIGKPDLVAGVRVRVHTGYDSNDWGIEFLPGPARA